MASLITFTPGTTIKSADANTNFTALNNSKVERSGDTMTGALFLTAGNVLWVSQQTAYGSTAMITFIVGDSDTGINWVADGHIQIYTNNVAVIDILSGNTVNILAPVAQVHGNTIMAGIGAAQIFVQSSTPGTAATGDIWIDTSISL